MQLMHGPVDFHTHAFPDELAETAVPLLAARSNIPAWLDGKADSLLASMDRAGIAASVICSVATRPAQFRPILDWSLRVASERLVPFASIHPDDPRALQRAAEVREAGLKGVKLHPYYQDFVADEPRMMPLYAAIRDSGLVLMLHTGRRVNLDGDSRAAPAAVRRAADAVPGLKLIAPHLGAWGEWEGVEEHLLGRPVWLDVSYVRRTIPRSQAMRILLEHPEDYLLLGSDSPWDGQAETVEWVRSLDLGPRRTQKLLEDNARRLLEGDRG